MKILALALAIAVSSAFAGGGKKKGPEWAAFKECKQRVEQGAKEDCSALKPTKDKAWKKDKKRDGKRNWKKGNKNKDK